MAMNERTNSEVWKDRILNNSFKIVFGGYECWL